MDLDLWLRLLKENGKIYYYQSHTLAAFRIWEDTKTTQAGTRFIQNAKQVLDRQGARKCSIAKLHLFYMIFRIWGGKIKRRITKK